MEAATTGLQNGCMDAVVLLETTEVGTDFALNAPLPGGGDEGVLTFFLLLHFPDSDNAFLAGLLHDVGKLALLKEMASNYSFGRNRQTGTLSEESYGDILPNYHAQVGALVAEHWNMSKSIRKVIAHHHDLKVDHDEDDAYDQCLVHLVHLSDVMARLLGHGRHMEPLYFPGLVETLLPEVTWDEQAAQFFNSVKDFVSSKQQTLQ